MLEPTEPERKEKGWLPDYLYRDGRFGAGVAMFADATGRITHFSCSPEDLSLAQRLPRAAILPGLINVHSHSFQRAIRGRTEHRTIASGDSFWTWREAMYHVANKLSPEDVYDLARMAFLEGVATGITTVGEFHYLHHQPAGAMYADPNLLAFEVVRAARDVGVRIELQRTVYMRAGWQRDPNPGQARFVTSRLEDFIAHTEALRRALAISYPGALAWVGVAMHSVRAVPLNDLLGATEYARSRKMKIHMHVSEQPAEIAACMEEYSLRPIELLDRHGILDSNFTGVHATHITRDEAFQLGKANALVCVCPTTERNLGDGIGDAELWAAAGVGVCFGSDSNVQTDLLEDARELEYHLRLKRLERAVLAPNVVEGSLAACLFANATEKGAASLGAPGGLLEEGRPADFFTVNLDDLSIAGAGQSSLLTNIVFSATRSAIRDVYVGGRQIIQEGHHPLEEEVVSRFKAVQQKLWDEAA
jgi:formimidoylglutamate deiminase